MCIFSINVNTCAYLSIDVNTYKFRSSLYRYYEYCIHVNALYMVQQITIEWSKSIPHIESVAWCAVLSIAFPPQSHTIWDCNIDWFWMVRNLSWFTAYLSMLVGRLGRYIPTIGSRYIYKPIQLIDSGRFRKIKDKWLFCYKIEEMKR